jgi:hypothetical protein
MRFIRPGETRGWDLTETIERELRRALVESELQAALEAESRNRSNSAFNCTSAQSGRPRQAGSRSDMLSGRSPPVSWWKPFVTFGTDGWLLQPFRKLARAQSAGKQEKPEASQALPPYKYGEAVRTSKLARLASASLLKCRLNHLQR